MLTNPMASFCTPFPPSFIPYPDIVRPPSLVSLNAVHEYSSRFRITKSAFRSFERRLLSLSFFIVSYFIYATELYLRSKLSTLLEIYFQLKSLFILAYLASSILYSFLSFNTIEQLLVLNCFSTKT